MILALRGGGSDAFRRRFLLGFEICGWAAVAAYVVSCSRPARWSLVSVLLPFQTGYMLAPFVGESWRNLKFWNILVDTAILISLPLILASVGGVLFCVRFTMRRIVIAVGVIAIVLAALVTMGRRIGRARRSRYLSSVADRGRHVRNARTGPHNHLFSFIPRWQRKAGAASAAGH